MYRCYFVRSGACMPDTTIWRRNFIWGRANMHFLKFIVKLSSSRPVSNASMCLWWSNQLWEKITPSSMYVSAQALCWYRIRFIYLWQVAAALRNLNGMATKSYCPGCMTKDLGCLQSLFSRICQYFFLINPKG